MCDHVQAIQIDALYIYVFTLIIVPQNGAMSSRDQPLQKGESPLRICSLSKEEFTISKDAKFSPGHNMISFWTDSHVNVDAHSMSGHPLDTVQWVNIKSNQSNFYP